MGRLINENSVIEQAEKCTFTDKDERKKFFQFVKYCVEQSETAYDVEKVVAELEEEKVVLNMSDLISRQALLDAMDKRYKEKKDIVPNNLAEGFMQMEKLIKEQPTAYDVEKVVAELEELPTLEFGVSLLNAEKYVKLSELKEKIDIVRKGGV